MSKSKSTYGLHSSISEFNALPRDEVLELLVQCISRLSPKEKTILALYYHEDLEPAEIAACVRLTEGELDQVRAETVGLLRTMLVAQIGLPERPASFDKPYDADGADVLVNGQGRKKNSHEKFLNAIGQFLLRSVKISFPPAVLLPPPLTLESVTIGGFLILTSCVREAYHFGGMRIPLQWNTLKLGAPNPCSKRLAALEAFERLKGSSTSRQIGILTYISESAQNRLERKARATWGAWCE